MTRFLIDEEAVRAAAAGKLSDRAQLAAETNRLIVWQNGHRKGMIGEAERVFTEILRTNRTLETFIKPDFTWGNERLLTHAMGRRPNYAERDEIKHLVRAHVARSKDGAGFRDLLLDLIRSEAFRTR